MVKKSSWNKHDDRIWIKGVTNLAAPLIYNEILKTDNYLLIHRAMRAEPRLPRTMRLNSLGITRR